jgi:hypothetical protein
LSASGAFAQDDLVIPEVRYPALPATAANAEGFAPAGWAIERRAGGDLDGDGAADLAFVLRMRDPANILSHDGLGNNPFDTNPRILGIAFAAAGGRGYRLALQNHVLIPRRDFPTQEDPFFADDAEFAIAGGKLRLSLYRFMNAGGWDMGPTTFTFRWRDGALRLIGYDFVNVRRNSGRMTNLSINYLTRRVRTATGNIGSDRERVRWTRLRPAPLPTIDHIGDGLAFDPEGLIRRLP